jgi:hypothetical protein
MKERAMIDDPNLSADTGTDEAAEEILDEILAGDSDGDDAIEIGDGVDNDEGAGDL